ncbi:catalase [Terrimicrobium sacchariphilum]|uniref:Catalase-related peroxidase n=1 Tax=Terrimicrobium sacchariphilum TaxID=690879 RepID=A0A146G401_TERSA|nr:catalase family peroxidase [Terrimicrobium sacchariphilum]GAT32370.1 catalase [Terrimicrobium sacchariphilum]
MKPFLTIDPTLTRPALLLRLAVIGLILGGAVTLFAWRAGWLNPHTLTQKTVIDTFEKVDGVFPGFRRNHAKGVCFRGYFESNGNAAALSRSGVFLPGRIPVLGRFSFGGGLPYVADAPATVRALAVQFQLPNGEEWRTAMINLPVFPVQNVQQFAEQLVAFAPDPATGKPDPAKIQAFVAAHPATARALPLIQQRPISSGFADTPYYGLNAFTFLGKDGKPTPVRWTMVPEQPFQPSPATAPATLDKNYLFDGLIAAVRAAPQKWRLILTLGQPGDPTNDATITWPDDRPKIDAGTLVVEQIESEAVSPARDMNFDPTILPDGIAVSDDPLLSARSATYSVSFTRREGERKEPSAVTTAETGK